MSIGLNWTSGSLLVVGLSLLILYFAGRKSVHSEQMIAATSEELWKIITDISAYGDWNPVFITATGELKVGNKVSYTFSQDGTDQTTISAAVISIETNRLLEQRGGIAGLLTFQHQYLLETEDDGTKLVIHEDYRGIGVNFWNPAPVQSAYDKLLEAIVARLHHLQETKSTA